MQKFNYLKNFLPKETLHEQFYEQHDTERRYHEYETIYRSHPSFFTQFIGKG